MIYYFSGTGNTRWLARTLAAALNMEAVDILQKDIDGSIYCRFDMPESPDEPIGFAFPIHGWQPPKLVRRYVQALPPSVFKGRYVFAVCTCGDETGDALSIFRRELREQCIKLDFSASVQMPNTYVCLPFMDTDPHDVEQSKIAAARDYIPQLAERIRNREQGEYLKKGTAPWLLTHVIGEYFNRHMISDRKFSVDKDRCIHCGKCVEACPVGNVTLGGPTFPTADHRTITLGISPKWLHSGECTGCLACYHVCPCHAISYGKRTDTRGQFYNTSE